MNIFRPGGLELTEKAAAALSLGEGMKVLDVGCGLGASLEYLAERFGVEPHGVDISRETVARSGRSYILRADAENLPYPDGSFDAVLMECSLSLFACPEKALDEARRVLKNGGGLGISALSCDGAAGLLDSGRVDFSKLAAYLRALGFEVTLRSDESAALRQFIGEAIFSYGSLEEYAAEARRALDGCVLDCRTPKRGTGYKLLTAQLDNR